MICPQCNTLNLDVNTKCLGCNKIFSEVNIFDLGKPTSNKVSISKVNNCSIEYKVSFFEIILSYPYLFFKSPVWIIVGLLVATLITLDTAFVINLPIIFVVFSFILMFALFGLLMFMFGTVGMVLVTLVKSKELLSNHILTYNDEALKEVNSYSTKEYKWDDVEKVYISSRNIYLQTRQRKLAILPRRIFSNSEFDVFIKFIFTKIRR